MYMAIGSHLVILADGPACTQENGKHAFLNKKVCCGGNLTVIFYDPGVVCTCVR